MTTTTTTVKEEEKAPEETENQQDGKQDQSNNDYYHGSPLLSLSWSPQPYGPHSLTTHFKINLPVVHGHVSLKTLLDNKIATKHYLKTRLKGGLLMHPQANVNEMISLGKQINAISPLLKEGANYLLWVQVR